jgi:hypothetical protein
MFITIGQLSSNGHRYITRGLHSRVSLGTTVIERRNPDMTAIEERSLSLAAAEDSRDPAS